MVLSFKMPKLGKILFVLVCFVSTTHQVHAGKPICPCDTDPGGCCPNLDYKLCPDFYCHTYGDHGDYSRELAYDDPSECSLTCKVPKCGNYSVYTCGGASRCQFKCDGGNSCSNTILDGSKSHTLEVSSAKEPFQKNMDIARSIIHSSGSQKCHLFCGGLNDCSFVISACKAPYHLLVCSGRDSCDNSIFNNDYSKNYISCTGRDSCSLSIFHNTYSYNEVSLRNFATDDSQWENDYSTNVFELYDRSGSECLFSNTHSINLFICGESESCRDSIFDNSYSENIFNCTGSSCSNSDFDNSYSNNKFFADDGETLSFGSVINQNSVNDFTCVEKSCRVAFFDNRDSYNTFLCESEACPFSTFSNGGSENIFRCDDSSCEETKFLNSYSKNTFVCNDDSCSFARFDNSYSHNEVNCTDKSCDSAIFKNTHSENRFLCEGVSCNWSSFNNRYSKNTFVCGDESCLFIVATNTYSENDWMCEGDNNCGESIFDYSFSRSMHICDGSTACSDSVFYVNYAQKFNLTLKHSSEITIDDVVVFCYDSNCQTHCLDGSCFQLQYTCGGSYGTCLLTTEDTGNQFFYHCYGGAHCELQCGDDCGLDDQKSTLNCESAGYCIIDCGEGDCDDLQVQVGNSPILFKSNIPISENCTVIVPSEKYDQSYAPDYQPQYGNTYGYQNDMFQAPNSQYGHANNGYSYDYGYNQEIKVHTEFCDYLKNACHEGVYLCNAAEYIKSRGEIAPVCAWSPYACPESDCHLSSLEIHDAHIGFDPFTLEYHISLYQKKSLEIEAHAVNSYSQIALGQMNARGSVRMTYDLALDGYGYSEIDIAVCSPGLLTCVYKLYVHVEGK